MLRLQRLHKCGDGIFCCTRSSSISYNLDVRIIIDLNHWFIVKPKSQIQGPKSLFPFLLPNFHYKTKACFYQPFAVNKNLLRSACFKWGLPLSLLMTRKIIIFLSFIEKTGHFVRNTVPLLGYFVAQSRLSLRLIHLFSLINWGSRNWVINEYHDLSSRDKKV